jgi:hypothetical protein
VLHHPPVGLGLDGEIAARGELHRAQDPDRVLTKADVRIADGAHDARLQIGQPLDVVDHLLGFEIVEEPVDGEVAPAGVLLGRAEDVVAPDEQIARLGRGAVVVVFFHLARVGAKGGGLDDLRTEEDVGQSKPTADDPRVVKAAFDLVGGGAGDDVEVLRLEAEQEVAHAATDQVRGVPGVFQSPDDVGRVGIDLIQGDVHRT